MRGLAAGDKNGGPAALATLLCVELDRAGFSEDGVFGAYYRWVTTEGFDTGPTLKRVCFYVQGGCSISEAVEQTHWDLSEKTAGVGPAHRAAPLALLYRGAVLDDAARREARLSHHSPIAAETSVVTVRLCAHLLDGIPLEPAMTLAVEGIDSVSLAHLPLSQRHRGGYGPGVLQAAVSFLTESASLQQALAASLQFAGPANYCPVLVGSIGACAFADEEIIDG